MLLLAALILLLLALMNYRIGDRSLLHPAVVFSLVWAIDLFLIWVVGDFFYPMSPVTLLIFVGGACAFSVGSASAFLYPKSNRTKPIFKLSNRLISWCVAFELLCVPLAVRWMLSQIAEHESLNFFLSMSRAMTDDDVKLTLGYTLFANLVIFSNMSAVMAFFEREAHRTRWRIAFALALGFDLAIAARSAFVPLFLSIFCLDWLRTRRIRWKLLMTSALVLAVLASLIAVYLGKADADPNASVVDNSVAVVQGLVMYAAGGPVAFDRMVRDPSLQRGDFQIGAVSAKILNRFGAGFQEPDPSESKFVELGPHHLPTNVYTIYSGYTDLGYPGMMAMVVFLGFAITLCYKNALLGNRISTLLYGWLFSGLVLSPFTELFFNNLNYLSKFCLLLLVVYALPGLWIHGGRSLNNSVDRELARRGFKTVH